jgi:hypothetical protein
MMTDRREGGAVLLVVLVALALLASLAGVVARISQSEIASLRADRAAFDREGLTLSAIAYLGAGLATGADIPEDGQTTTLDLPGGQVLAQVQAASGLINPNFAQQPTLIDALTALGASQVQALTLTGAIEQARGNGADAGFRHLSDLARLFADTPDLWVKVRPYITLLGKHRTLDATTAPLALRAVAMATSLQSVDISGLSDQGGNGFYEIRLHVVGPRDLTDPDGRLWAHVTALLDRSGRLRLFALDWPQPEGAP